MSALTARLPHVFRWPIEHPIHLLLPGMVIVSLLLHALAAYLIVVRPPPPADLSHWQAKLVLLPDEGKSGVSLLAARDPSWMAPGRYRGRLLPEVRHERMATGLKTQLPPLLAAPPAHAADRWAPALPPVSVRPWLAPPPPPQAPPSFAAAGARFESGAAGVTDDVLARLRAVAPDRPPGHATELFVVLAPTGDVRHAWVLHGSGDAALDLAAQRAVQRARFASGGRAVGDVLHIFWGPRSEQQ